MSTSVALQAMFEGLYMRALQPEGAFKDRLREKGFDLDRQQVSYPMSVWSDCLDVTADELYPGRPRAESWQRIGRQFIDGYFSTLVGRMIAAMLPFLSAKAFLGRVPRFITTGLQGAVVKLEWVDEQHATLTIGGVHELSGAFMAGVLEGSFARMRVSGAKIEAQPLTGIDSEIRVTLP
ncbi:MAG: DUF2378 family protein [Archangium sp.]|nr:DUF2378 family protein [Archangium sp.]